MKNEIMITVFTPTYNRAYIISKLYRSLCAQTNKNFKWLVIDDGSTDETKDIVMDWIRESKIEIEYCYQNNAGKMAAYNNALKHIKTKLFVCVDSDDYLVADAIQETLKFSDEVIQNKKLSGIVAYRGDADGNVLGNNFPKYVEYSPLNKLYEDGFKGDTTLIFKTDIAKQFLFPILPGEKFISEMYVYNQIDDLYSLKLLRKVLTVCNYLEDGYTKNGYKLVKNNPMGWALIYQQKKQHAEKWRKRYIYAAYTGSYVLMASPIARKTALNKGLYRICTIDILAFPVSVLLYFRRKWVHRNE